MTIIYFHGDLIKSVTQDSIIVHGCNMQGVMGAGFAKRIKETYPEAYQHYMARYRQGLLNLGDAYAVNVNDKDLIVVNAITQVFYGRKKGHTYVDYSAIRKALATVNVLALYHDLEIHMPRIGCNLGGGRWEIVKEIIEDEIDESIGVGIWEKEGL